MVRISFGPAGEFFMETSAVTFSSEDVSVAEELYKRIMNARSECDIIHEARRAAEGDAE